MATKKANGHITADELRALKPVMVGDMYWGQTHADRLPDGGEEPRSLMYNVLHHMAVRGGIADENDLFGFLNRIPPRVLNQVGAELLANEDDAGPLAPPTGA